MGITLSDYQKLLQEKGSDYLKQLYRYVMDKSRRMPIKSIKGYLFGVLKKSPTVETLQTPASCSEQWREKQQLLAQQQARSAAQELKVLQQQAEVITNEVDGYLDQLDIDGLHQLQKNFNDSRYGHGLKFGKSEVDFTKSVVKATFKRYIYSQVLEKEPSTTSDD